MDEPGYQRAARIFYDTIAAEYAERFADDLDCKPFDRAMLAAFAERVDGSGPVVDAGCGPGRLTGRLASLGIRAVGMDLSRGMLAVARGAHPDHPFLRGSLTSLPLASGALAGLLAWYSLIHLPPQVRPAALAEFHRVLAPGGHLLLAFQAGGDIHRVDGAWGHPVALGFHRIRPERIAAQLTEARFTVEAQLLRAPDDSERAPQAFVLARRPRP